MRRRTRVAASIYACEGCQALRPAKDMRFDHKEPVVDADGFRDWNTYISRMFDVIPAGIQHLCLECHKQKTAAEREARTLARRAKKQREAV